MAGLWQRIKLLSADENIDLKVLIACILLGALYAFVAIFLMPSLQSSPLTWALALLGVLTIGYFVIKNRLAVG